MAGDKRRFILFTKPWPLPLPQLATFVKGLGFDGIELPVRNGFQVEPARVAQDLPAAVRIMRDSGLEIVSVAGTTDEALIAACGQAGVPMIRICPKIPPESNYLAAIEDHQRKWDALLPALQRAGVTLGIQNHFGRSIANGMQLRHAVSRYDPARVCIVWDAGHNALQGEVAELALDTVWSHLRTVNLKNAFWRLKTGPEAPVAQWSIYWTTGRQGLANWPLVATEVRKRGFAGDICLTAEYSDEAAIDRLIGEDIRFAKSLFASPG